MSGENRNQKINHEENAIKRIMTHPDYLDAYKVIFCSALTQNQTGLM